MPNSTLIKDGASSRVLTIRQDDDAKELEIEFEESIDVSNDFFLDIKRFGFNDAFRESIPVSVDEQQSNPRILFTLNDVYVAQSGLFKVEVEEQFSDGTSEFHPTDDFIQLRVHPSNQSSTLNEVEQILADAQNALSQAGQALPPSRTVYVDQNFSINEFPLFDNVEQALTEARAIAQDGKRVALLLYFDSNGQPLSPSLDSYGFYSEQPVDSYIETIPAAFGGGSNFITELVAGKGVDLNELGEGFDVNQFTVNFDLGTE